MSLARWFTTRNSSYFMREKICILLCLLIFGSVLQAQAQIITTIAGTGTEGSSGDGGPATAAQVWFPDAVAIDDLGNIFISAVAVRKIDPSGIITTIAGNATMGGYSGDGGPATAALFGGAYFITLDKHRNLYISDNGNGRIRKIDTFGIITTVAGNGTNVVSGNEGPATAAGLMAHTCGICVDDTGNLYIGSGFYIRKVDTFGIIHAFAGTGNDSFSGDGGQATAADVNASGQLWTGKDGSIYFGDAGNFRIRKISTAGIITTVAGNGFGNSGNDGPATAALLHETGGVCIDKCGNMFIAEHNGHRIRMVNTDKKISVVAGTGFGAPMLGNGGWSGDGGPATVARIDGPLGMWPGHHNDVYFADRYNQRIRRIQFADSCTLGIGDMPVVPLSTLLITPSPTSGTFTISLPVTATGQVQVTITDITGRVVGTRTSTAGKAIPISLAAVPGMYLVTAEANGVRYVGRVQVE